MEDSHDFGLGVAKGVHAVLLCKIQESRVNWAETNKIDRIRKEHVHKVQNLSTERHTLKCSSGKDNPAPCNCF